VSEQHEMCVLIFYTTSETFLIVRRIKRGIVMDARKFLYPVPYIIVRFVSNLKVLDIWIKRDQPDVTCFFISLFNAQHVSDVNTSILRSLRLICWVISWVVLLWYDDCWCYVVVWLGWCGVVSGWHTPPPQPNHNVIPTHIVPEQYNPWNNSTNKSQAPEDGCINFRNMLSSK